MLKPLSETPENHVSYRFTRLIGLGVLGVGGILAKWQIYDPLHAAENGSPEIWISVKVIGLAILLIFFGLAFVIFGNRVNKWLKVDVNNIGWKNALFYVFMAAVCIATFLWVRSELLSQGYR
jgi:hypothetical protein